MTAKPYTEDDVELVAATLWQLCSVPTGSPTPVCYEDARAVLGALADAGRLVPVDDDPRHIIEFRPDGWTIKHPLACRLGDLFGCRVNLAAEDLDFPPPVPPGRYEASVSDIDGRLQIGERVDVCTCPTHDVSTLADEPGTRTMPGLDLACPIHGARADQAEG